MKINFEKTKMIVFNPCKGTDFMPQFTVDDHRIEVVEEIRCLGLIVRADLKWISNTRYIVRRAYQKLWMVKRLKNLGAHTADLVDIFEKHVRSVLEFGTIVWHPSITQSETIDIERVQKSFCRIVLGDLCECLGNP